MRSLFISLAFSSVLIAGCATTYDPVEVCSAEWIKPRVDRAVGYIERDTKSLIKTLNKNADEFKSGKTPGPFQMIAISSAVNKLTKQLKNGQGVKDLKILRETCNDPDIVENALTEYMQDQGLPLPLIGFIKGLKVYRDVVDGSSTVRDSTT